MAVGYYDSVEEYAFWAMQPQPHSKPTFGTNGYNNACTRHLSTPQKLLGVFAATYRPKDPLFKFVMLVE